MFSNYVGSQKDHLPHPLRKQLMRQLYSGAKTDPLFLQETETFLYKYPAFGTTLFFGGVLGFALSAAVLSFDYFDNKHTHQQYQDLIQASTRTPSQALLNLTVDHSNSVICGETQAFGALQHLSDVAQTCAVITVFKENTLPSIHDLFDQVSLSNEGDIRQKYFTTIPKLQDSASNLIITQVIPETPDEVHVYSISHADNGENVTHHGIYTKDGNIITDLSETSDTPNAQQLLNEYASLRAQQFLNGQAR